MHMRGTNDPRATAMENFRVLLCYECCLLRSNASLAPTYIQKSDQWSAAERTERSWLRKQQSRKVWRNTKARCVLSRNRALVWETSSSHGAKKKKRKEMKRKNVKRKIVEIKMNHKRKENAPINKQQLGKSGGVEEKGEPVLKSSHKILSGGVFLRWKELFLRFHNNFLRGLRTPSRVVEKIIFQRTIFSSVAFQKHEKSVIASHRFPPCDDVFFHRHSFLCTTRPNIWGGRKIFWWFGGKSGAWIWIDVNWVRFLGSSSTLTSLTYGGCSFLIFFARSHVDTLFKC